MTKNEYAVAKQKNTGAEMGIIRNINMRAEINELMEEAQLVYGSSKTNFERQKEITANKLEKLGKVKLKAWTDFNLFTDAFSAFADADFQGMYGTQKDYYGSDINPKEMYFNIKKASMNASEVLEGGYAALEKGALIGIAAYAGVMRFGKASTGTAIRNLNGIAKDNATLAWFGHGSKASGGFGMAGGKVVLAGIVIAPLLYFGASVLTSTDETQLYEAQELNSKAKKVASELDNVTNEMKEIESLADDYTAYIDGVSTKFVPVIKKVSSIASKYRRNNNGGISFVNMCDEDKDAVELCWRFAVTYYNVLSETLLTDEGRVLGRAKYTLEKAKSDLNGLARATFRQKGSAAHSGDVMWQENANKMLYINLAWMTVMLLAAVLFKSLIYRLVFVADAVLVCPFFMFNRELAENQKYKYRIIKLIGGILIVVVCGIIL